MCKDHSSLDSRSTSSWSPTTNTNLQMHLVGISNTITMVLFFKATRCTIPGPKAASTKKPLSVHHLVVVVVVVVVVCRVVCCDRCCFASQQRNFKIVSYYGGSSKDRLRGLWLSGGAVRMTTIPTCGKPRANVSRLFSSSSITTAHRLQAQR